MRPCRYVCHNNRVRKREHRSCSFAKRVVNIADSSHDIGDLEEEEDAVNVDLLTNNTAQRLNFISNGDDSIPLIINPVTGAAEMLDLDGMQ
jgi:hypothetical protein